MAGNRFFSRDVESFGRGRKLIYFSFNTNNGGNPNSAFFRGVGDLFTAIVGNVNTGEHTITFSSRDFYNRVLYAEAQLEEVAAGDAAWASIGNVTNEASTTSAPLSIRVFTNAANGTKTNYTNRRVWVALVVADRVQAVGDP